MILAKYYKNTQNYKVGQKNYKVGQLFPITKWGKRITKWGRYYKVGHNSNFSHRLTLNAFEKDQYKENDRTFKKIFKNC